MCTTRLFSARVETRIWPGQQASTVSRLSLCRSVGSFRNPGLCGTDTFLRSAALFGRPIGRDKSDVRKLALVFTPCEDRNHSDRDTGPQVEQHVSGLHLSIFSKGLNESERPICRRMVVPLMFLLIAFAGRQIRIQAFQMLSECLTSPGKGRILLNTYSLQAVSPKRCFVDAHEIVVPL
jgi:hypothetical protein